LEIKQLSYKEAHHVLPELIELLWDLVESGASIGFLAPLETTVASLYWQEVFAAVRKGSTILFAAHDHEGRLRGTVQLALAVKPNALHRAEVQKLLVARAVQHQGIGTTLMKEIETVARTLSRSLVVLDTRVGDPAEKLYAKLGYQTAGIVPSYAKNNHGEFDATRFMYKLL
jgi:ribosomal protein S18 acetylase RimI-like enzyme